MHGNLGAVTRITAAAVVLASTAVHLALAQPAAPVALVEDVSAGVAGVEAFDYVPAGKHIQLGGAGKVVLGYLASCVEETIAGGSVTVGAEQSAVVGGAVQRKTIACAGKPMQLTAEQSGKSGGLVFRRPPSGSSSAATEPPADRPLLIPGAGPVVSLPKPGRVTIARIDGKASPIVLDLPAKPIDLGKRNVRLAPGGTYRATYGSSAIVFQIDAQSTSEASPLARLIRF